MRSKLHFAAPLLLGALLAGCTTIGDTHAPMQAQQRTPVLHVTTYGPSKGAQVKTLVVVLHGEGTPAHYSFAANVAKAVPDSAAVAMLRPGYENSGGDRSPGDRGDDTGDNITADRIAVVADSIRAVRANYPNARTIIVGHSSGAAMAANLSGLHVGLVDGLVLVGCPCTLPEWRKLMKWSAPVESLDPLKTAGGILPGLRAAILVGATDKQTPVRMSRAYAEALALRGVPTDYRIVPKKGHDLLDDPEVLDAVQRLAANLVGKN